MFCYKFDLNGRFDSEGKYSFKIIKLGIFTMFPFFALDIHLNKGSVPLTLTYAAFQGTA